MLSRAVLRKISKLKLKAESDADKARFDDATKNAILFELNQLEADVEGTLLTL